MNNTTKVKVFTWLYRIFTYFVPGGVVLWAFLIDRLISKEVTVASKLGLTGIFVLATIGVIAVFFYGRHLKKKIEEVTDECIVCVDNAKKTELVEKKKKYEAKQSIFRNACFLAPFVLIWAVLCMVEKGVVSLRGTLMFVCLSMATGFGFNATAQWIVSKGVDKDNDDKGEKVIKH